MLSIAVFTECYHPMRNGVVVSISSFTRMLQEMGHEVTIFTARHPDQNGEDSNNIIRFPSITFPIKVKYPIPIPLATREARERLRGGRFDVIHTHAPMMLGHFAMAYRLRSHLPLVFTYHTMIEDYTHYVPLPQGWSRRRAIDLSRIYCNASDHVIAPTPAVEKRLRQYRVNSPISVIPTGIDIDIIDHVQPGNFREQYNIPQDVPLLAYAGRIAKEKNIPRLLSSFREIVKKEPDTHMLLIGGGPYDTEVQKYITENNLDSRVKMTGFVPREQLIAGLKEADLFVFASVTETQGLVIGEAMACNLPTVAVTADATMDLIDNGCEGLLTSDNDGEIADAAIELIRNKNKAAEMGVAARARVETISARKCTERLIDIYHRVISNSPSKHDSTWQHMRELFNMWKRRR
jgi:1,2-diacylglycerol 3-alpha-glucosyltransferase